MATITRVFDLLPNAKEKFQIDNLVCGKYKGSWKNYSTNQFISLVDDVSRGLISIGVAKDDKVAIMSPNRPEWNICDFGIMQIGATQVPMYPTLSENDIRFILTDADIHVIFVSDQVLYDRLNKVRAGLPDVKIYLFDELDGIANWKEVCELGAQNSAIDLSPYRDAILPEDTLTLIYTSGTTGTPKGVMLSHANLVSNVLASSRLYPGHYNKALSFLPISHIFERMVIYMYFYLGISVYYAESLDTIMANLNEIKPHGFTTVPRLLEKVYDRIVAKGSELTGIKRNLFFWALNLSLIYEPGGSNGWWYNLQLKVADKLVYVKWREALGGNIAALVSGGAALQPRLARVFWAAGMPVLEGYGLTETSPVIAVNGLGKGEIKIGTVGKPLDGVEVKIAADGEILCKGPNVMKGYYKRPDLTAEVIDADGFFHTGDIGEMVDGEYLRITDRKKEIFKTAGGKYVAPQILENKFKESVLIEQVMIIGENRRFPSALIVPCFASLETWCNRKGIAYTNSADMIKNEQVKEKIKREVDRYNTEFGHWEQVKKFELLPKEWSIDGGELTPKMSLKRKVILEKNKDLIEKIYSEAH